MTTVLDEGVIVPVLETETIRKAFTFAYRLHQGQFRTTGEPFINHPIRVANYVCEFKSNSKNLEVLKAAALLHDTVENTALNYYDLVEFFGPTIAALVMELTTDEDMKREIGKTKYLEIRLKNMTSWALTIKLCDRLDNCSDLHLCDEAFRIKYRNETIDILEYLLNNRELTGTQKKIVLAILRKLEDYIEPAEAILAARVAELKARVSMLRDKTFDFGRVVNRNWMMIERM